MSAQPSFQPAFSIRRAVPADAVVCGRICYEAFKAINEAHNFPPDLPAPEAGVGVLKWMFSNPKFYCVVAEVDGAVVGSNCLDERSVIAGVGPITVDPNVQNRGIGRALMQAVIDRGAERRFAGVRLLQAAFHSRSMSLYTKLGFVTREPVAIMQGRPTQKVGGITVRPATQTDVPACDELCERVHGFNRSLELLDGIGKGSAKVAERNGHIVAFTSGLAFFDYSVSETTEDLCGLIASAEGFGGPGILVPTRNHALFNWCLESGLKVVYLMTLMTTGLYNEPSGAYLPSVLY